MNCARKLLTIIIPSYNMEKYLSKACDSLSECSLVLENVEVIVVNDGSKDGTSEIAHSYQDRYPSTFRVIDKPNGHYGSCVNAGLSVATGEFVRVLDADDYMNSESFDRYVRELLELRGNDSLDLILSDYNSVGLAGNVISSHTIDAPIRKVFDFASDGVYGRSHIGHPSIAYRAEMLRAMNYKQSEGSPYTDTEWYTLPMGFVRNAYYMPLPTMCILVEREGQTMTPDVYARDFGKVAKIVLGIAREEQSEGYLRRIDNTHALMMRENLKAKVRQIYESCLLGINGMTPVCDLREFDHQLKTISSDLYNEVRGFKDICHLKIDVVSRWRSGTLFNRISLAVFRLYVDMVRIAIRIIKGK